MQFVNQFHGTLFSFCCVCTPFLWAHEILIRKLSSTQLPLVMNCRVKRSWKPSYAMRISLLPKWVTKKTFLSSNFRAAAPATWQLGGHFKDKQDVNWITQIQLNSKITKTVIHRKHSAPCATTWIPKKSEIYQIYSCFVNGEQKLLQQRFYDELCRMPS